MDRVSSSVKMKLLIVILIKEKRLTYWFYILFEKSTLKFFIRKGERGKQIGA